MFHSLQLPAQRRVPGELHLEHLPLHREHRRPRVVRQAGDVLRPGARREHDEVRVERAVRVLDTRLRAVHIHADDHVLVQRHTRSPQRVAQRDHDGPCVDLTLLRQEASRLHAATDRRQHRTHRRARVPLVRRPQLGVPRVRAQQLVLLRLGAGHLPEAVVAEVDVHAGGRLQLVREVGPEPEAALAQPMQRLVRGEAVRTPSCCRRARARGRSCRRRRRRPGGRAARGATRCSCRPRRRRRRRRAGGDEGKRKARNGRK